MAYIKTVWENGDVITKEKLNNIEDGIANAGGGSPMKSTTYAELLAMRNAGTLTPGMQYRIIDYVCTTTQEESRAVSHPFDVIVVADDASTLNENARACLHEGDTYYTAENHSANLEAWELKYCIDNDRNRFAWADATNGKGVIFWMKDDRGNECPYDFKQIQFKRYKITECTVQRLVGMLTALEHAEAITAVDEANPVWVYTYTSIVFDPEAETPTYEDGSVAVMNEAMGCIVYGNVIKCYLNYADMTQEIVPYIHCLNNIVFINSFGSYCINNTFGINCRNSTFAPNCNGNIFIERCNSIIFGHDCNGNIIGSDCINTILGGECTNNIFGSLCDGNIFIERCYNNTFGNGCTSNTFGKECNNNTFGNGCTNNVFGEECNSNTFGKDCAGNTFGKKCNDNSFWDRCGDNTFGGYCRNNTFGIDCTGNNFSDNCTSNNFGVDCNNNTFGEECSGNSFGDHFYRNTFKSYCNNNTFGNNCGNNTHEREFSINTFGDSCNNNIFGKKCNNNIFGDYCGYNTFGDNCDGNIFGDDCANNSLGGNCNSNSFETSCYFIIIPAGTEDADKHFYHILSGTRGRDSARLTVPDIADDSHVTYVGLNSSGELKTWVPADLVTSP